MIYDDERETDKSDIVIAVEDLDLAEVRQSIEANNGNITRAE